MFNSGSIQVVIGADISGYQAAMRAVVSETQKAFNAAKEAAQSGSGLMQSAIKAGLAAIHSLLPAKMSQFAATMNQGFVRAGGMIQRVMARIGERIPEPLKRAFARIGMYAQEAGSQITQGFQWASRAIQSALSPAISWVKNQFGALNTYIHRSVGVNLANAFRSPSKALWELASGVSRAKNAVARGLHEMGEVASKVASRLPGPFQQAVTGISQTFHSLGNRAHTTGNQIVRYLGNVATRYVGNSWSSLASSMGSKLSGMVSIAGRTADSVANAFNPLVGRVGNVASRMVSAFGNGMNSMAQKATSVMSRISAKFSGMGSSANGAVGSIKNLFAAFSLANIASRAVGILKNSFDSAISRFDTLKQFPKIMQSWGYSAEEASAASDKLVKGIDGLPTKLDDITSNVRTLVTSGLTLSKATDVALAFNNAMLASGASTADAEMAMTQYSQMVAVGKVDQMAWNSVVRAAGKPINDVAEALLGAGKNQADLYKALQDGTVTMDEFNDKMIEMSEATGGFAEQAKKGSEGVRTSMTNLATAVSNGMATIIEVFDSALEARGLTSLAVQIERLKPLITGAFNVVADKVPAILDKFEELGVKGSLSLLAIPAVLPKVLPVFGQLGMKLAGLGSKAINAGGLIQSGFEAVGGSLFKLGSRVGGLGRLLSHVAGVGVSALGGMVNNIVTLAGFALSAIGPAAILGLVVAGLGVVNNAFGHEISAMLQMVTEKGPMVISQFVSGIVSALPQLIESGTQLIMQFAQAMTANIPVLIESAYQMIATLVQGIGANAPQLIQSAVMVIGALANGIISNLPRLLALGMNLLLSLAQGIAVNMPLIVEQAGQMMMNFAMGVQTHLK